MSSSTTRWGGAHWIRATRITSSRCTDEVAHRATRRIGDQSAVGDAATAIGRASSKRETVGSGVAYKTRRVGHDSAERQLAIQQVGEYNGGASWTIGHVHRQRVLHQLAWRHGLTACRVRALADRHDRINRMSRSATRWGGTHWIRSARVTSARRTDEVAHRTTGCIGDQGAVGDAATAIGRANGKRETVGRGVAYKASWIGHDGTKRQLAIQQVGQHNWTSRRTVGYVHRQRVLH